jgi:hypothetical protein
MVTIVVKHNFPEVQRQLDQLQREVAEQAMVRAINGTLNQAKTRMVRAITAEFNIKASAVRESLRVRGASRKVGLYQVEGFLESPSKRGRSRNLIHFGAKQTATGVQVQIKRVGPKKIIRGAFIAKKDNKYGGVVFMRTGKSRLPIEAKQTIDVGQMFNTKRVNELVVRFMQDKFTEVFTREAKFYTDRFNARRAPV